MNNNVNLLQDLLLTSRKLGDDISGNFKKIYSNESVVKFSRSHKLREGRTMTEVRTFILLADTNSYAIIGQYAVIRVTNYVNPRERQCSIFAIEKATGKIAFIDSVDCWRLITLSVDSFAEDSGQLIVHYHGPIKEAGFITRGVCQKTLTRKDFH